MPRSKENFENMREATRNKLEDAALSLFARKGVSVKINEIAQAAGISQGLLYSHYPSKEALIAELARQAVTSSSQNLLKYTGGSGTAAEKIKGITEMMCRMFTYMPKGAEYFMFMIQVGMSDFKLPEAGMYSKDNPSPFEIFTAVVSQGQAEGSAVDGDSFQLTQIYWAAIQGLCCYTISGMPISPEPQIINRILLKEEFL